MNQSRILETSSVSSLLTPRCFFFYLFILELMNLNYAAFRADNRSEIDSTTSWSFIRSQRGAPLIMHSGFVYRCERKINSRTYWLCIRYKGQKCNARLILNGNVINKATEHNHPVDERSNESNVELKNLEDFDVEEWIKGTSKISSIKLE